MLLRFSGFFTLIFFIIFSVNIFANPAGKTDENKEFDVNEMIMHHIKDAHEFHIMDIDGHAVSFPLPIILWTDNGLVTFLSSEFNHNDSGEVIVERKGQEFIKYHEKIFYANNTGGDKHVIYDVAGNVTNKKPLDLSITKMVFSMFLSMLLLILIFVATARTYSKSKKGEPTGLGKFTEPLVMFIKDEVALPMIGEKNYQKYMPFLLTLFFFIWINNVMGLIPFFPFSANLSGNIAFTFVLATITFIITTVVGNKDYWKHIFWMPGVPVPMKLFLAPIEFLGIFIKPISLMIRLFANISAGHIIILSLISLIFIFKSLWLAPASLFFSVFISLIEVLVVAIQAYIFTMLSALYIGSAIEEHEH
jgi:F-type H+-transporting ATPase subunit a